MNWVDRLVEATAWDAMPGDLDWFTIESTLGTPLPVDFKELRRRFASWGAFSDHAYILTANGGTESILSNHESLLRSVRGNPDNRVMFEPFGLFGVGAEAQRGSLLEAGPLIAERRQAGLLQWGYSLIEEEYYWLVDTEADPSEWPVVARKDSSEPFKRFDMTASEFIYRVLTESEFRPFGVASKISPPYYQAY
ncbi:hypothetical protein [Streptomyces rubiginosohelvolus]|uniref:hypothetical protein n=1 Tax=Streptomyces rubiginosohelvolus TaxID=67362 RepID=UPI0036A0CDA4